MSKSWILGVGVDDIPLDLALKRAGEMLSSSEPHFIVTANPEIILHAYKNNFYLTTLNKAHISLPDGFGLRVVSPVRHRVTGVDFAENLLNIANTQKLRIVCIIREDGLSSSDKIVQGMLQKAPETKIFSFNLKKNRWQDDLLIQKINDVQPQIIFVGLGFPEQELWLGKYLQRISSARIGIGVGSVFDLWSGAVERAPQWMRTIGLEWFWRLIHQPSRLKRIIRAVVVFPIIVIINSFKKV